MEDEGRDVKDKGKGKEVARDEDYVSVDRAYKGTVFYRELSMVRNVINFF